jgi:hypothetical protein
MSAAFKEISEVQDAFHWAEHWLSRTRFLLEEPTHCGWRRVGLYSGGAPDRLDLLPVQIELFFQRGTL